MWETNNLFAILDSIIYRFVFLKRYPSNFVTLLTEHWYQGGVYHSLCQAIRDEKIAEAHREFEEDVEKVPRAVPRRDSGLTPRVFRCNVSVCFAASSWLGKSTNSTRSRKSCSAEKISWVQTDLESWQHLPWIQLVDTSKYYQAVGFQKG